MQNKEFKNSELGRIPEDWQAVELGAAGYFEYGYTASSTTEETGVKFVRITDVKDNGLIAWDEVPFCTIDKRDYEKYALTEGDILFARIGATAGKTAFVDRNENAIFASYLIRFNVKDSLDPKFTFFFTQSEFYWNQALRQREGQLKKGINATMLSHFKIIIPPLLEQRVIAEVLSSVDAVIQKCGEVIVETERLKKGLMRELLTKGIGRKEFRDSELGRIPEDWEVVALDSVIEEINTGFASGKRDENGIVQIRMNNVTTDGRIVFDSYLKVPVPENVEEFLLKENDFLFNNTNSIDLVGKSAIFKKAPFPCVFSNHFTRIRFKKDLVLPDLILHHFLDLWGKNFFKSVAIRHVGQSAVQTKYLLKLKFPRPSLQEQRQIAEILSVVDEKLELERKRKAKLERIKKGLMNDLLTGRKRVKNQV